MRLDVHTSLRTFLLIAGGIYVLLVVGVAILPAAQLHLQYPPDDEAWTSDLVRRGREIYQSQGCVYCHTQQLRGDERLAVIEDDGTVRVPMLRPDAGFGLARPARAEDYRNDSPPFMGTQRTGPDLTNVGVRLPGATWHFWHLYDPRIVSPDSNMPGLPWLFHTDDTKEDGDRKVDVLLALEARGVPKGRLWATPDAQALVEYLLSLQQEDRTR
jgi:cytochrome c oxidase cbb3-type subunit 2